jgi:hypothetical protein
MAFLGWLKPKCPIDFREKGWIETRMSWLGEHFGVNRLIDCRVIAPPTMHFCETYESTSEGACQLSSEVQLKIEPQEAMLGRVGQYAEGVISVVETQMENPVALTATLAHELSHHILMGRKLLENDADMEWVTDLMPVIFGLGIFSANATIIESHERVGNYSRWNMNRQGYLPSRMIGYAMSLHAWLCNDLRPEWSECLRHDAAETFWKGIRYLSETADSLLQPDNLYYCDAQLSMHQLLHRLKHGTTTEKFTTLWELARRGKAAEESIPVVAEKLRDRQPAMRAEAARTLSRLGPAAQSVTATLLDALSDSDLETRDCSVFALGQLRTQPEVTIPELIYLLQKQDMVATVAWALAQYGSLAAPALPDLVHSLKTLLGKNDWCMDYLAYAIRKISPSPEEEIQRMIASCDIELQRQANEILPKPEKIVRLPSGGQDWRLWPG